MVQIVACVLISGKSTGHKSCLLLVWILKKESKISFLHNEPNCMLCQSFPVRCHANVGLQFLLAILRKHIRSSSGDYLSF